MKYCPTCETKYDEDILRFCMKDGTPLIDEEEPNFIQMPSESLSVEDEDDPSEVTIVRQNKPKRPIPPPPPSEDISEYSSGPHRTSESSGGQRIVVPTTEQQQRDRAANARAYAAPPPKANTAKVVVATIFLTLLVLTIGAVGFWAIQRLVTTDDGNTNLNTNANFGNEDTNVNTNLEDANFDFNTNSIFNSNSNSDDETPTPSPTVSPSPSPSATATPRPTPSETPTPTQDDDDDNDDDDQTPMPTPRQTPVRRQTPLIIRPDPSPANSGRLNGRAVSLPKPVYPETAKRMRVSGRVTVRVAVDRNGNIISARAIDGPTLLRSAAENAARRAKMPQNRTATSGTLVYNFQGN